MNFKEIVTAWRTAANPSPEELAIAEQRYRVCRACPNYKTLTGFLPYCAQCLCPLDKKVFSNNKESCPDKRWEV